MENRSQNIVNQEEFKVLNVSDIGI